MCLGGERIRYNGYSFFLPEEIVVVLRVRPVLSKWGLFYEFCLVSHSIYIPIV